VGTHARSQGGDGNHYAHDERAAQQTAERALRQPSAESRAQAGTAINRPPSRFDKLDSRPPVFLPSSALAGEDHETCRKDYRNSHPDSAGGRDCSALPGRREQLPAYHRITGVVCTRTKSHDWKSKAFYSYWQRFGR